jgi:hypothetical protein
MISSLWHWSDELTAGWCEAIATISLEDREDNKHLLLCWGHLDIVVDIPQI